MQGFVERTIKYRTNELFQSEDADSIKSEHINVDGKFLQALKSSFEVKNLKNQSKQRKKIKILETKMEELFQSTTMSNVTLDDIIALAIAYFNMGLIYIDCTEKNELHACENYFMRCFELLKGQELHCKAILTSVGVCVKLRCILIKQQKTQYSEHFLHKAMELYLEYTKEENEYPNPINIPSILGIEEEELNSRDLLDELHLTTISYLLKQYQRWPKNETKLVIYIHNLLNKQIPETMKFLGVGCYYWALSSIKLTEYFLLNCRFTEARHHLAAAEYMMEKFYKDKLENTTSSESLHVLMLDKYKNASANIARYWGFYGNILLRSSRDKFYQQTSDKSCKTDNSKSFMNSKENITDFLFFTNLEKDLESITSKITDTYILNFNDAKTIFMKILNWLNIAQKYFTVKENFVTHGRILLETSLAYKYFAYFEYSRDNLIKMYKRRIEILEKGIEKLHLKEPTTEKELLICNQIYFELGTAYTSFLSIRDERSDQIERSIFINTDSTDVSNTDSETLELMKKANEYLTLYLNSQNMN